jgi:hypothetical protein
MVEGVPLEMQATEGGQFSQTTEMTPFGDKHMEMAGAALEVTAVDVTANHG